MGNCTRCGEDDRILLCRKCRREDEAMTENSSEQRDDPFEDALDDVHTGTCNCYQRAGGKPHVDSHCLDVRARLRAARVPPATDAELEEGLAEFEAAINRKWAADLVHNEMKDEPTRIQFEMRTAQVAECGARIRALFSLLSTECESYKTLSHELDQQGYTREQVRRAVRHFVERWSGGPIADSVIDKGLSQLEDDGDE
jgi:hypothetical protein